MGYFTTEEISQIGFKKIGSNVLISRKSSIYNSETISLGNNVRIDDNVVISGNIEIGDYVHLSCNVVLTATIAPIKIGSHCTVSYGTAIFSAADDFSGQYLFNPMEVSTSRNVLHAPVIIENFVAIGAGCVIFPGCRLAVGTALGAISLLKQDTSPWSIYAGTPARKIRDRDSGLLSKVDN